MLKQWVQRWIDLQGPPSPDIGGSSGRRSEGVLFCSRHSAGVSSSTRRAARGRTGGTQPRSWFHRHIGDVLELCARPDHIRDEEQYRQAVIEIGRILEFIERESRRENQPVLIKSLPGLLHPDLVAVVQPSERSSPAPAPVHQRLSLAVDRAEEIRYLCSQSDNPFIWLETGRWIEANFPKIGQHSGSSSGEGGSPGTSCPLFTDRQPAPSENGSGRSVRISYGVTREEREALGRTICIDKPFQLDHRHPSPEYSKGIRAAGSPAASGRISLSSERSDTTSRNRVQAVIGMAGGRE